MMLLLYQKDLKELCTNRQKIPKGRKACTVEDVYKRQVWDGQALYFHSACEGHKTDALNKDNRVSFCVVERDTIVPWLFATDYRSAILFGRAQVVQEDEERRYALERLNQKYAPDLPEEGQREIAEAFSRVCIIKLVPEHLLSLIHIYSANATFFSIPGTNSLTLRLRRLAGLSLLPPVSKSLTLSLIHI